MCVKCKLECLPLALPRVAITSTISGNTGMVCSACVTSQAATPFATSFPSAVSCGRNVHPAMVRWCTLRTRRLAWLGIMPSTPSTEYCDQRTESTPGCPGLASQRPTYLLTARCVGGTGVITDVPCAHEPVLSFTRVWSKSHTTSMRGCAFSSHSPAGSSVLLIDPLYLSRLTGCDSACVRTADLRQTHGVMIMR